MHENDQPYHNQELQIVRVCISKNDYILLKLCILSKEISKASFYRLGHCEVSNCNVGFGGQLQKLRVYVLRYYYISCQRHRKMTPCACEQSASLSSFSAPLQARFPIFRNRAPSSNREECPSKSVLFREAFCIISRAARLSPQNLWNSIREKGVNRFRYQHLQLGRIARARARARHVTAENTALISVETLVTVRVGISKS